jgi:hypothetical protein
VPLGLFLDDWWTVLGPPPPTDLWLPLMWMPLPDALVVVGKGVKVGAGGEFEMKLDPTLL